MSGANFSSAGVKSTETDLSGPRVVEPVGIPAGVIGTAVKGPAFVPVTVGIDSDFYAKFGLTDGKKFGPIAAVEWLRNARALTYLRVLGVGTAAARLTTGNNLGSVAGAGFVVGSQQPDNFTGALVSNPYANLGGPTGRLYVLGALMSESLGSTYLSDAGRQGAGAASGFGVTASVPVVRGVLMAPSGVLIRLSSSVEGTNTAPTSVQLGTDAASVGKIVGAVKLLDAGVAKQEFVMFLNGHIGADPAYPNVITASFDTSAVNYFANVLNRDPYKMQQAGHLLYASYDVTNAQATVTGSGLVANAYAAGGGLAQGVEPAAFVTTGSAAYNLGAVDIPNYENWEDRFSAGRSPWVVSQKFGGQPKNLFRFWMIDDGAGTTKNVKISIESLTPSTDPLYLYPTFDVVIRDYNDRDLNPRIIESFRGVNLDTASDRYIAKVIGDQHAYFDFEHVDDAQKLTIDGNYPNKSNYVRVEVAPQVDSGALDDRALPMGFRGPQHLVTSGSMPLTVGAAPVGVIAAASTFVKAAAEPPVPMRLNIAAGSGATAVVNPSYYWGVQFSQVLNATNPNASTKKSVTIDSMAKYFPGFQTVNANVFVGDNAGAAETAGLGVVDSDLFNKNLFTLENVQVVTNSAGYADSTQWVSAQYVRAGVSANDTAKTRAFSTTDLTQPSNRRFAKFTFFLQGGFDGTRIFDQDTAEMTNIAITEEMANATRGLSTGATVASYKKAVDIMKSTTDVDIQLLAIPGIRNPVVTDYATAAVEDRFDAMFLMDIEEHDTNDMLVSSSAQLPNVQYTANNFANRGLNSSFAAAYYPDVIMTDPNTGTNLSVPPSTVVLGAYAYNDKVSYPWFAPAGLARGALATATETTVKLKQENIDALALVDINPLVMFPGSAPTGGSPTPGGVTLWGQQTLLQAASALDRINVRRLLIDVRREVKQVANTVIFEPNREATLADFKGKVDPILARVQKQGGLARFKVIIDTTTTTQNDIDNNTIRGRIYVQPLKSIEFVSIDFAVSNKGSAI